MSDFDWDPDSYRALMAEEIPDYPRLQEHVTSAVTDCAPATILDLGIGSGLTALQVMSANPHSILTGLDSSQEMLSSARTLLSGRAVSLHLGDIKGSLPAGPFDMVMSTLAVHHLLPAEKAALFSSIAEVLTPGGSFVLGDLIVPEDPADVVTPIDGVIDVPSPLGDQLKWMRDAGLEPSVRWKHRDLAVVSAVRRSPRK